MLLQDKLPQLDVLIAQVLGEEKDGRTAAEAILMAMRAKATKGDVKAAELMLNRAYGKPKDNEGQATQMIINVLRKS